MNALTLPRTVAATEYKAARLPLTLIERQVVARLLDDDSSLRLAFEKALGSLDATVGRALKDAELTRRGAALTRKAEVLTRAVALEEKAAARKEQADAQLQDSVQLAERQRVEAQQEAAQKAKQVHDRQQAERRAAEEKAQATARAKTAAAEQRAQAEVEREEKALDARVSSIETRTKARTAAPKAQLQDAVSLAQEATAEKAKADRLHDLAEAERTSRS